MKHHILIIGTVWPEPNSSAAGSRMMQLIYLFKSLNWQITFCSSASDSDYMFDLESIGIHKKLIELNNKSFDHFIAQQNPKMVLFDRFITEEQFGWRVAEFCPGALRILDTEDLHCLRYARQLAVKESREVNTQDYFSDYAKREIASIFRCDLSLIISEFEMELLNDTFKVPQEILYYLPFLIEPQQHDFAVMPSFEERENFVFIGNFLHEPNWDAVQYLRSHIWPKINVAIPNASMFVYGAYTSQKVLQLHNEKIKFYVKGRAESVEDVMKNARVTLAPLRYGAGLKGKLLDAMICGTPSITTKIGAEGMNGVLEWPGVIADHYNDFVEAAIELYTNKDKWIEAQQDTIQILDQRFNNVLFATNFILKLESLYTGLIEHRSNNFIGAMMQYQTMNASKYMARWIEEKNKN